MKLTPLERLLLDADKPGLAPQVLGLVIILVCLAAAVLIWWI